jgi:hypothetical protein
MTWLHEAIRVARETSKQDTIWTYRGFSVLALDDETQLSILL